MPHQYFSTQHFPFRSEISSWGGRSAIFPFHSQNQGTESECKAVTRSILLAKPVAEVQSLLLSPQVQVLEIPLSFPVRQRAAARDARARCVLPSLPSLTSRRSQGMGPEQPAPSSLSSRQTPARLYFGLRETEDGHLQNKKANRKAKRRGSPGLPPSGAQREQLPVLTLPRTGAPRATQPLGRAPERAQPAQPRHTATRTSEIYPISPPLGNAGPGTAGTGARDGPGPAPRDPLPPTDFRVGYPSAHVRAAPAPPPAGRPCLYHCVPNGWVEAKEGSRSRQLSGPQPRFRHLTENPVLFPSPWLPSRLASPPVPARDLPRLPPGMRCGTRRSQLIRRLDETIALRTGGAAVPEGGTHCCARGRTALRGGRARAAAAPERSPAAPGGRRRRTELPSPGRRRSAPLPAPPAGCGRPPPRPPLRRLPSGAARLQLTGLESRPGAARPPPAAAPRPGPTMGDAGSERSKAPSLPPRCPCGFWG